MRIYRKIYDFKLLIFKLVLTYSPAIGPGPESDLNGKWVYASERVSECAESRCLKKASESLDLRGAICVGAARARVRPNRTRAT